MVVLRRALLLALAGWAVTGVLRSAPVYASREQALARAFPSPATIERKTYFLTDVERESASRAGRAKVDSNLVVAYVGRTAKGILGTGYFDTHTVRTMPQTLLVVVRPDGTIGSVEVIAFGEPEDYLPRRRWLQLFRGRRLDGELSVGRGLAHVTGATLTTRSIADAARRVLAIHAAVTAGASK